MTTRINHTILSLTALLIALIPTNIQDDDVREKQWLIEYLDVEHAHEISTGDGVIIGMPDSGVFPHRDFATNLLKGTDTTAGGDGTGKVDQIGHGTEMAGIIIGHGRHRNSGVLGIAPAAKLLPIKIFGTIDDSPGLAPAIYWALNNGADIVNVSSTVTPSRDLNESIAAAARRGAIVISAAGNRSKDLVLGYPAAIPGVLAVGATTRENEPAIFSVRDRRVEICAPGVAIVTTGPDNSYHEVDGTSAAAAVVSGAAALVRARFPELSAPEVVHRLTYTATDIGAPGRDDECGFGVVDIVAALTAEVPPLGASAGGNASPGEASPAGAEARGGAPSRPLLTVVLGVSGGIVALAALVAFLALRRRRAGQ